MRPAPSRPSGGARPAVLIVVGVMVLLLSIGTAVTLGPSHLGLDEVVQIVLHQAQLAPPSGASQLQVATVWQLRMPRVLLAVVSGAGLGLCGAIMQALLRNPLADPYLLGVSSGASTGAVCIIVLGIGNATLGLPVGAFLGAIIAFVATMILGRAAGGAPDRIVLSGVAVSQGFQALTTLIIMAGADPNTTRGVLYWLTGSLASSGWDDVGTTTTALVIFLVLGLVFASRLDSFAFGDAQAATLGVSVTSTRRILLLATALMTAVVVSFSGVIGFIGLVVPHIARPLVGSRHRRLLPASALLGAIFLVWADCLSRTALAPLEIPVGVMTALVGVPVFMIILARRGRR